MSQINNEGVEKLNVVRNALNSMWSKLSNDNYNTTKLQEEFNFISQTLSDATETWDRVEATSQEDNVRSVVINGKTYKSEGV